MAEWARHEVLRPVSEWAEPLKVAVRQASVGPCLQKKGRVSRSAIVFVGAGDG